MKSESVFKGFLWRLAERIGAQGVTFFVSIILARLLDPSVYGVVALITVFTSILQVFVDSGMGNALIQKKKVDNLDFSTVFYFNITICLILYLIMFLCSPLIASFYGDDSLISIIRVMSLVIVISGVKNVQQAYVSRNMLFRKFFFATIGGTIISAIVGIILGIKGFGVWALVVQNLLNQTIDTIILWITVKWRPILKFSFKRLRTLFVYGWKILASALLETVYNNVRTLIIGKIYTKEQLSFYNEGDKLPKVFVTNINASIDSVLLPALSKEQDDKVKVKEMTRRSIKTSVFALAPLMMGLAFTANNAVSFILTDKWLPCVFFLRLFCISYMFWPIHTANLNAINALGRSDIYLKLEVIKKVVGIILLISTMWISVEAMAWSVLISSLLSQIINSWPNRKLLNYSYLDQLKDIIPTIIIACIMGICLLPVNLLNISVGYKLLIQVVLGAVVYFALVKIFKVEAYDYIKKVLQGFKKNGKKGIK